MTGRLGERRRQRCLMATDTEWQVIAARAKAAGLTISRYVAQRLAGPAVGPPAQSGMVLQAARDLRVLVKIEERRFRDEGAAEAWEELVAEAGAETDGEEAFG